MQYLKELDIVHFTSNFYMLKNQKVNFHNNYPTNIYGHTEKIRISLKKIRDFILCCRKTLDEVDDVFDGVEEIIYKPKKYNIYIYIYMSKSRRDIYTLNGIIHNKGPRKSIFNWNHISDELSDAHIEELKSYYKTYHKKCWAYKQAVKRLKNGDYRGIHYPSYLHPEVLLLV